MSDLGDIPTLTDDEIETRRVNGGAKAWETPRLTELGVAGSRSGGNTAVTEQFYDDSSAGFPGDDYSPS